MGIVLRLSTPDTGTVACRRMPHTKEEPRTAINNRGAASPDKGAAEISSDRMDGMNLFT
jgi:hypothetical protein